jgi:polyisoprenoid-binding protein YceI
MHLNATVYAAIACLAVTLGAARPTPAPPRAFDLAHSKITVYVYKQGMFSFLADNHQIDAPITAGRYDGTAKSVEFTVATAKMKVLDPKMPPSRRDSVQKAMDDQVLEIAKYPTVSFRSTAIEDRDPKHWTVTGDLNLHGQTHAITVQVQRADASHFSGSATIRQTAFGITPIRIAGGIVSVKDDVTVEFEVVLSL